LTLIIFNDNNNNNINSLIIMKFQLAYFAFVLSFVTMPSTASYTGTPLANKMTLKVGKAMGPAMNLAAFGKHNTHRRNDMVNEILTCQYNAGNFMASHAGDFFAIGVNDLPLPFSITTAGCGQCYLFEHTSGRTAIGVAADNCAMARGCQGAFDVSDAISNHLLGTLERNIENNEITVTPVECNWDGPMQYVFLGYSNSERWYINIQRNSVPIKRVAAHYTGEKGKPMSVEALEESGKWSIFFKGPPYKPADEGKTVTLEIEGVNGVKVYEPIAPPPGTFKAADPLMANPHDLTALAALPIIKGTQNLGSAKASSA
jgi:hypothetical protein